jgi:hypothetical protein
VSSCQCRGIEKLFNTKRVAKELRRYRKRGPRKTTRMLIDAVRMQGVEGKTLLDVGGGIGAIQHGLLRDGATRATSVDASTAYHEAAEEEAARRGLSDRVDFHYGDFVEVAQQIREADIVTLDRVICCYDDMETLVRLSTERARQVYGLVYPRDSWWVKSLHPFGNFVCWITRVPFRVFIYSTKAVDGAVRRAGFHRVFHEKTPLWQVAVYARS